MFFIFKVLQFTGYISKLKTQKQNANSRGVFYLEWIICQCSRQGIDGISRIYKNHIALISKRPFHHVIGSTFGESRDSIMIREGMSHFYGTNDADPHKMIL